MQLPYYYYGTIHNGYEPLINKAVLKREAFMTLGTGRLDGNLILINSELPLDSSDINL